MQIHEFVEEVMFGHGAHAMTGASLVVRRGYPDDVVLDGGPDAWSASVARSLAVGS